MMEVWLQKANIPYDRIEEKLKHLNIYQPSDLLSLSDEMICLSISPSMKPLEKIRFDRSLKELRETIATSEIGGDFLEGEDVLELTERQLSFESLNLQIQEVEQCIEIMNDLLSRPIIGNSTSKGDVTTAVMSRLQAVKSAHIARLRRLTVLLKKTPRLEDLNSTHTKSPIQTTKNQHSSKLTRVTFQGDTPEYQSKITQKYLETSTIEVLQKDYEGYEDQKGLKKAFQKFIYNPIKEGLKTLFPVEKFQSIKHVNVSHQCLQQHEKQPDKKREKGKQAAKEKQTQEFDNFLKNEALEKKKKKDEQEQDLDRKKRKKEVAQKTIRDDQEEEQETKKKGQKLENFGTGMGKCNRDLECKKKLELDRKNEMDRIEVVRKSESNREGKWEIEKDGRESHSEKFENLGQDKGENESGKILKQMHTAVEEERTERQLETKYLLYEEEYTVDTFRDNKNEREKKGERAKVQLLRQSTVAMDIDETKPFTLEKTDRKAMDICVPDNDFKDLSCFSTAIDTHVPPLTVAHYVKNVILKDSPSVETSSVDQVYHKKGVELGAASSETQRESHLQHLANIRIRLSRKMASKRVTIEKIRKSIWSLEAEIRLGKSNIQLLNARIQKTEYRFIWGHPINFAAEKNMLDQQEYDLWRGNRKLVEDLQAIMERRSELEILLGEILELYQILTES